VFIGSMTGRPSTVALRADELELGKSQQQSPAPIKSASIVSWTQEDDGYGSDDAQRVMSGDGDEDFFDDLFSVTHSRTYLGGCPPFVMEPSLLSPESTFLGKIADTYVTVDSQVGHVLPAGEICIWETPSGVVYATWWS
jgi:hypothetical protein